jgi:hypothetical protein
MRCYAGKHGDGVCHCTGRASIQLGRKILECRGFAELVAVIFPVFKIVGDRDVAKDVLVSQFELDQEQSDKTIEALDYIDQYNHDDATSASREAYRQCIIK